MFDERDDFNKDEPTAEDFIEADKEFHQYYPDDMAHKENIEAAIRASKVEDKSQFVTKKMFVLSLIIAMIATSLLTAFLYTTLANLGMPGTTKQISATNYTLAKSTGSQLSAEEVVAKNEAAVVEIRTESVNTDSWLRNYVTEGAGSGVIIDSKGFIVTNNHVINGASKILVKLKSGEEFTARLIGTDPENDVAVIKINSSGLKAAQYGDSSKLSVGQMTIAIGNPLGKLGGSATMGIISSLDRELTIDGRTMTLLQTDASINPGNSGGGLFDGAGNMIGLVVAKSSGSDVEGLGFAIPINKVASIVKDLISHGKITGRPIIGVQIVDISEEQAKELGLTENGVYVQQVTSKKAEAAGIKAGDKIYSIEGHEIENAQQLKSKVQNYKIGEKIKVVLVRDGKKVNVSVELTEGN